MAFKPFFSRTTSLYRSSEAENLIFVASPSGHSAYGTRRLLLADGEEAEEKTGKDAQFNIKLLLLYVHKGCHCVHEENNQACGPGALTLREATGLLLNKEAVSQQNIASVGSHLVLCNENQRGTSTDSAATPSSRSRSRKKRVGQARM